MGHFVDMKCEKCGTIFEYDKGSILNSTPDKIKCPECKSSKHTHKVFDILATSTAEGLCGNAKTGYSKGITYHCSTLTSGKGTKI